jgi:biotin carboxyl carrier protein
MVGIHMRTKYVLILIFFTFLFLSSCATTRQIEMRGTGPGRGVWHRVQEGQTLWRIAKTYRVGLEEIKEANDINDVVHIARGTWIFIPRAEKVLFVQGNVDQPAGDPSKIGFIWPVHGDVVRTFGKIKNDFSFGLDIQTKENDVVSSLDGVVVVAGVIRGYGNTIIIEHGGDFCSLYARNLKILVKEGQKVKKNTVIARIEPGRDSGEATHFELFYRGKPVNPLYYLP